MKQRKEMKRAGGTTDLSNLSSQTIVNTSQYQRIVPLVPFYPSCDPLLPSGADPTEGLGASAEGLRASAEGLRPSRCDRRGADRAPAVSAGGEAERGS